METRTVTLPKAVVEALYRQAKDELEMFARVAITPDQVKGNARMFYLYGEHLPAIVAACAPDDVHYLIMSPYFDGHIGCTTGEAGKADVLSVVPGVTFQAVDPAKCPVCLDRATYFTPPCTCRIACSVGDVNYLSGIDDCPVHGFGPNDENATTNEKEKDDERATD